MAFIYINKNNRETLANNIVAGQEDLETRTLDNFYKHFNGLASVSLVMFAIFFSFGRIFVDVFFGYDYLQYQTSLSFIFLANCTLLLGLLVFQTAYRLEPKRTFQIVKIFLVCISVLFVFMNINHPDTVAFFVIGSVLVLSIFLYNFSIRKPAYIERTYTALF
jgi:O-antigen/teichoic acid export membrane protein